MKYKLILLLIFILVSCSKKHFSMDRIAGKYMERNELGTMELHTDSNYFFTLKSSIHGERSTGRWINNGREISLMPYGQSDTLFEIKENKKIIGLYLEVEVIKIDEQPFAGMHVSLYSKSGKYITDNTNKDGKCFFLKGDYDSLVIQNPWNKNDSCFPLQNKKLNYFKIKVNSEFPKSKNIFNKEWKYRSNSILGKKRMSYKPCFKKVE